MGCRQSVEGKKKEGKTEEGVGGETVTEAVAQNEIGGDASAESKIIAVLGSTGLQGGSVARALKGNSSYKVRAVTRNPDSDKAKALAEQGAEVVKADLDDKDSLQKAMEGCYGVFGVTNYWDHMDVDREVQQGKNIVDAAKAAGVKHLIFSGGDDVKGTIDKDCFCYDGKNKIETYIKEQEVPFTVIRLPAFYENLLNQSKPEKKEDGTFELVMPVGDVPLHMICVHEIGEVVLSIFNDLSEYQGKIIGVSSDHLKVEEYAAILSKALDPKKFKATEMTPEQFGQLGFPGAETMGNMFEFFMAGKCERDGEITKKLHPNIPSFEQWVDSNKDALNAVTGGGTEEKAEEESEQEKEKDKETEEKEKEKEKETEKAEEQAEEKSEEKSEEKAE